MKNNIYYLAGFMAAGKSTIGPILANTLGWDHYDLDWVIEKNEGKKVKEIFQSKGEEYFRKIETNNLVELSKGDELIISLGGGTLASEENLNILKSTGKIFYLKSSPEMAYERLKYKRDRPNLLLDGEAEPNKEKVMQRINELLKQREKYYKQADYIIDTDFEPVGKTVDKIAKIIKSSSKEINE